MFEPVLSSLLIYVGALYPAQAELGVNHHPQLAADLIEWAYEGGVTEIKLAAQTAPGFDFGQSWQLAGYGALKSYGVDVLDLAAAPRLPRRSSLGLYSRELLLPRPLLQADCLINMGKFRVAEGRIFGSALGNLAELAELPRETEAFSRALVDIYSMVTPDLHIIDALSGKRGWQPQKQDGLLAASDAVALDMTLAALAALPAAPMEELNLAAQYGLGCANAADISLVGDVEMMISG
jgi:uncharacterized protein (DUF362 family)